MKAKYLVSILLFITLSISLAAQPQTNIISNSTYFIAKGGSFYMGVYYYQNGQYYNSTSGVLGTLNMPANCTFYPSFTPSMVPYCIYNGYNPDTNQYIYFVTYLDTQLVNSLAMYEIGSFPSVTTLNSEVSGEILLFKLTDMQGNSYNFSILPFNLTTSSLVCPKYNINSQYALQTAFTNGNVLVYSYLDDEGDSYFVTESCTSNESVTTDGPNIHLEMNLFAFNESSVLVNYYIFQNSTSVGLYVEPAEIDGTNQLNFGDKMNVTSFKKYNDTHMFINYVENNYEVFGLFVITPALEFVEVLSFDFGFNVPIDASPILGTSSVLILLGYLNGNSAAVVYYDLNTNSITQVSTSSTPIFLSNGSTISTTQYGYFIQSPGEPFYFVQSPFSSNTYLDPTDYNQTYTLFVPSSNYNYYTACLLTHFNTSSSTITQNFFPNCPLTLASGNPVSLKDVKYAADGTLYICYRDAYGSLFIVNSAGSLGPFRELYPYLSLQVSLNLTNGTASFAGNQLSYFVLGRFNISSGKVLESIKVPGNTAQNTISKVTDRYFILGIGGSKGSLSIYDMTNFNRTCNVASNIAIGFYNFAPILVFGFSEENPSNFTGLLYQVQNSIFVVNGEGDTLEIMMEGNVELDDVTPIGENSFIASEFVFQALSLQVAYEIKSWGIEGNRSEIEVERIEY